MRVPAPFRVSASAGPLFAALCFVALGSAAAQEQPDGVPPTGGAEPVRSDAAGALPVPGEWRCDRIAAEYDAFLKAGRPADEWRFAGKIYRSADGENQTYRWADWLRWYEAACDTRAIAASGSDVPNTPLVIGGVVAGVGVVDLLGSGSGSDSPG